jgi:hypothetical protein
VWDLLLLLPTNDHIYNELLLLKPEFRALLDPVSPHRLLYALQITHYLTEAAVVCAVNYPMPPCRWLDTLKA